MSHCRLLVHDLGPFKEVLGGGGAYPLSVPVYLDMTRDQEHMIMTSGIVMLG